MDYFWGLLFGLSLQLSIGPITLIVINKSIQDNFKEAFKMTLGVALIDALYILLSFFGVSKLLELPRVKEVSNIALAAIIIYFGIRYFLDTNRRVPLEQKSCKNSFFCGLKLTIVNPSTIILWTGVFGTLIATGKLNNTTSIALYAAGCVSSTILFIGAAAFLCRTVSKMINEDLLTYSNYFTGTILVLFGTNALITTFV